MNFLLKVELLDQRIEMSLRISPAFTAALFKRAKTWKQLKCPWTEERIKMM